ncbi:MAG: endolytic transglycosylase MltG [Candidatus Pacebacteria bacterium]|nr:endolytic transglycosylase MltG [Candidatus Paceibacterota bacterium]
MYNTYFQSQSKNRTAQGFRIIGILFVVVVVLVLVYAFRLFAPQIIDGEKLVTVPEGYSVIRTGALLEEEGIIYSELAFRILARVNDSSVKAGTYAFSGTQQLNEVLNRLQTADYGDVYERVTIPEGSTVSQIKEILNRSTFTINNDEFDRLTEGQEGYLFPDTYSFLPEADTEDIVLSMQSLFNQRIEPLASGIENSGRSLEDIIIMASIIEKEATGDLSEKKTVSGILWKRLDEGMLLQVDAPFLYINGEVRAADLRNDGPYNTYTRLGLTPTPIGNPGMDSIIAAIEPEESQYYYYLHGKDGAIRYGRTYREHVNNINRYLR